jgi:transposase
VLQWRIFRGREFACSATTRTERHGLVPPRSKLTSRAALLGDDDTTVAPIPRRVGVWAATASIAERETAAVRQTAGVTALGVEEHVWKPSARSAHGW